MTLTLRRRVIGQGLRQPATALSVIVSRGVFALKIAAMCFCFLWVRGTFPRYRYDQLMRLGWKVFLPFSLFWLVLTAGVLVATGWVPK